MDELVSVIIPSFRGVESLPKALKSVLDQSYSNIEIIVVDDNGIGTKEQIETEQLINKYKDVLYLKHEKNMNGAAARNTGLNASKGKYICFLDDDDLMLPSRVEKCVDALKKKPQYNAVFTDVICADKKMLATKLIEVRKEGNCYKDVMLIDMFFGTGSNMFFSRTVYEKIGDFDERFSRLQDLEYMIRFYRCFESTFIPEILLVKSKNSSHTMPNYSKLYQSTQLYYDKFDEEIQTFNNKEKEVFYKMHTESLSMAAPKVNSKSEKASLLFILKRFVYLSFPKTKLFLVLNWIRKRIKNLALKGKLSQEVKNFLKKYSQVIE